MGQKGGKSMTVKANSTPWRALATIGVYAAIAVVFTFHPDIPRLLVQDGVKGFWFMAALTTITGAIWGIKDI